MSKRTPTQKPYTEPILCKSGEDWFVFFRYYHAGKWHPKKLREDLNRVKDPIEKEAFAKALLEARQEWLKMGWNPILDPKFKLKNIKSAKERNNLTLNEAIDYGFKQKSQAKKGAATYKSCLKCIKEIAKTTGHAYMPISEVDRGHCLDLLEACKVAKNWGNNNYNKHLETLRAIFTECVDKRVMNANPLLNSRAKPVPQSNKYAPYTTLEKQLISEHLHRVHYRLYVVMQVVYHTGIRPKEALALLVQDIDLNELLITIAPDEERENSKTDIVRRVPINPHLYALLSEMELHKYPGNYFVFGTPSETGCRGRKRNENGILAYGAMRDDYFMPHEHPIKRDTATKLWKRLIQDDPVYYPITGERVETFYLDPQTGKKIPGSYGIGIKKHLYAAKRTGGRDSVKSGIKVSEMKVLYGHASERMTKIYTRDAEEQEASESIIKKAPAFTSNSSTNFPSKIVMGPLYPYIWAYQVVKLGGYNSGVTNIEFKKHATNIEKLIEEAKNKNAPQDTIFIDQNGNCRSVHDIKIEELKKAVESMANEYLINYHYYQS